MGFTEDYMLKINNSNMTTVLIGSGKFLEYQTNEEYDIYSIQLPFTSNGKHITVYSKEEGQREIVEDREYFDGKILSFTIGEIKYWENKISS